MLEKLWGIGRFFQKDFKAAIQVPTPSFDLIAKEKPRVLGKVFNLERGNVGRVSAQYDLAEISRAADIEPYIAQSIRKHREQILKEGYLIVSADDEARSYIERRLFEIALATGIPTAMWIREGITNLVQFHTAVLVLKRTIAKSTGKPIRLHGKTLAPIAGIFPANPCYIEVEINEYGQPRKYYQNTGSTNKRKEFAAEDVVFITIDKKTNTTFGTPYILPVLDDVRALRRIEELAGLLIEKEVFPLYHYKVGTEDRPAMVYDDGSNEVDQVAATVDALSPSGVIVTSERHEVKLVSREGSSLDIAPYLDYFEKRVLAGLRLSELDLGRGGTANRACYSADTETLTRNGWKYFWAVDPNRDEIATYNPKTGKLEWHKPTSVHVYPYNDKMLHFRSGSTDICVTPDHDMWAKIDGKWAKHKAETLNGKEFSFIRAAKCVGGNSKPPANSPIKDLDSLLRFIACAINFGKLNKEKSSDKAASLKLIVLDRDKRDFIINTLTECDIKYKAYDNKTYLKFEIVDKNIIRYFAEECQKSGGIYPDRIPSFIKELDPEYIQKFLEYLFGGREYYVARHHVIGEQAQILALLAGLATKLERLPNCSIITEVTDLDSPSIEEIDYAGIVYCFEVPNHLFVTRRNGCIAIQGNTAANINKIVQDAAKDYQEVFSQMVTFGIFLPLLLEGGFDVTEENLVWLKFPAIDREELRAHENHGLNLFLSSAITESELRRDYLGRKALSESDRKELERELAAEVDARLLKQQQAQKNLVQNKTQPTNQFKKLTTKPRIAANDYISKILAEFDLGMEAITSMIEQGEEAEIIASSIEDTIPKIITMMAGNGREILNQFIDEGRKEAIEQLECEDIQIGGRAINRFYNGFVIPSFWKALNPYKSSALAYLEKDEYGKDQRYMIISVITLMRKSLERLGKDQLVVAKRFGFAKIARSKGHSKIELVDKELRTRKIIELSSGLIYKNLLPRRGEEDLSLKLIFEDENGTQD
ncbi:MAG: hypothetical protein D6732_00520 [Methanobacteriota archaeon]|nr:MAG: hypothetical protein D6732_00520 [Euryarchaeota archaeon]